MGFARTAAGRGRLTPERELEVYRAVLEEILDVGYERFNYDSVAARAHCSKATLYRLWEDKLDLVINSLGCTQGAIQEPPDLGSLVADLHAWATGAVDDDSAQLLLAVARAALTNHELAQAVRERLLGDPDEHIHEDPIVARAIERGEVAADNPAAQHLPAALLGVMVFHELITGQPLTETALRDYLDAVVIPALLADPGAAGAGTGPLIAQQ